MSDRRRTSLCVTLGVLLAAGVLWTSTLSAAPRLAGVVVQGSSILDSADLFPFYHPRLGRDIPDDLESRLVNELARRYREQGYYTPLISSERAGPSEGVIVLRVREPRIETVEVFGDPGPYRRTVDRAFEALAGEAPLGRDAVQRALQTLAALPGLIATTELTPLDASGSRYNLGIRVSYERFSGSVRASNLGTERVGPQLFSAQIATNGLLRLEEQLRLRVRSAETLDEYASMSVEFQRRFQANDSLLRIGFLSSTITPDDRTNDPDTYRHRYWQIGMTQPFGSAIPNALVHYGVRMRDVTKHGDPGLLREEDTAAAYFAIERWWQTQRSFTQVSTHFSKGMDAFGSRVVDFEAAPDDSIAQTDFMTIQLQVRHWHNFGRAWQLRTDVWLQSSRDKLPSFERFYYGGSRFGRGFEFAELSGDKGVGGTVEFGRRITFPSVTQWSNRAYVFYDTAAAWLDGTGRDSAGSAGFGFEFLGQSLGGFVEFGEPLHPDLPEPDGGSRVLAELRYRF